MDAECDSKEFRETSERLGHVPIIDVNPRRDRELKENLKREARALSACGLASDRTERVRAVRVPGLEDPLPRDRGGAGKEDCAGLTRAGPQPLGPRSTDPALRRNSGTPGSRPAFSRARPTRPGHVVVRHGRRASQPSGLSGIAVCSSAGIADS